MAQLNKVFIIGNLTRDPEVKFTPKGSAVADIGVATNRTWKTESGEDKEEVTFVNCVAWGKQAEAAGKYLKKGRPVFIEGRLHFESWEKDGEKRSAIKIQIERLQFLGSGHAEASSEGSQPDAKPSVAQPDVSEDDIPF